MVINLATTGAANFPIWMEAHNGNASDKTILITAAGRMKKFCDALDDAPDFLYTGDSAFYENSVKHSGYNLSLEKIESLTKLETRFIYLSNNKEEITFSVLDDKNGKLKTGIISRELLEDQEYKEVIKYLKDGNKKLNSRMKDIVFKGLSSLGYNKLSGMKWLSRVPGTINEACASGGTGVI